MDALKIYENLLVQILECSICNKVLHPPVYLLSNAGNVCGTCFATSEWRIQVGMATVIENKPLNIVLRHMHLPCRFKSEGCAVVLKYDDLQAHKMICPFRPTDCFITGCNWSGSKHDIIKHFLMKHDEHSHGQVLGSEALGNVKCDAFSICFSSNCVEKEETEVYYTLLTYNGNYIARIKQYPTKVQIAIYDGENTCPRLEGRFHVRQITHSGLIVKFPCKIIGNSNLDIFKKPTSEYLTELSFHSDTQHPEVKQFFKVQLIYKVKHHLRLPQFSSIRSTYSTCQDCEELKRNLLECPYNRYVCASCTEKEPCIYPGALRVNKISKAISEIYLFPCVYEKYGCRMQIPQISNHESKCIYKRTPCPGAGCKFIGIHSALIDHVKSQHQNICCLRDYFEFKFQPHFERIIICYDRIFHFSFTTRMRAICWKVTGVGMEDECKSFMFLVGTSELVQNDKQTIIAEPCDDGTNALSAGVVLSGAEACAYFGPRCPYYLKITHSSNYQDLQGSSRTSSVQKTD